MAAVIAGAAVLGAAVVVVAVSRGAASAAGGGLAVGARATLVVRAQLLDAALAVVARAYRAGIFVGVALRVVTAIGGAGGRRGATSARAAQLRAEVVVAKLVGAARIGGAAVAVVAHRERIFAAEDAARLARSAAVFAGAKLA